MILLHRHSDAGARMGADSPELPVTPEEERVSPAPPTTLVEDISPSPPPTAEDFSSSCEEAESEGAVSEGAASVAMETEFLVCISALTVQKKEIVR